MKIVDLSSRAAVVEEMDRLDSPPDRLYRTLTQFQLVNRIFSRYRSVLTRSVLQDMAEPRRTCILCNKTDRWANRVQEFAGQIALPR